MRIRTLTLILAAGAVSAPGGARAFGAGVQDPTPQAQEPAPAQQPAEKEPRKNSHANDFLIRGTVFSPQGMSLPGAELRIRRAGEKKFRWEALTDRRGEFAVRVPQGSHYELVLRARGFEEQTRAVDAKAGVRQEDVVFRVQPASGGKTK